MQGRTSPPQASWTLLSRQILKSMAPLPSNTAHYICSTDCLLFTKVVSTSGTAVVGAFNSLCSSPVFTSLFPQMVYQHPICRCLQECSPLVLTHLTGVLASHGNKASTKHPSCDPSRVTKVVIPLTDFIVKHRHLHLLQSLRSAPICLGNKF